MTNEYETFGYELLAALAGVDTWDINLRDHPDAWKAVEQFAEKLQSAAYAEGRKDEAEAWPVPYVKIGIAVVLVSLALLYLCWFTEPKGGQDAEADRV